MESKTLAHCAKTLALLCKEKEAYFSDATFRGCVDTVLVLATPRANSFMTSSERLYRTARALVDAFSVDAIANYISAHGYQHEWSELVASLSAIEHSSSDDEGRCTDGPVEKCPACQAALKRQKNPPSSKQCATHATERRMRDELPCPWCVIDELKRNRACTYGPVEFKQGFGYAEPHPNNGLTNEPNGFYFSADGWDERGHIAGFVTLDQFNCLATATGLPTIASVSKAELTKKTKE